jgi:hypothetical protein
MVRRKTNRLNNKQERIYFVKKKKRVGFLPKHDGKVLNDQCNSKICMRRFGYNIFKN